MQATGVRGQMGNSQGAPRPPAKIADVARLAGVSVATVSRALSMPDVVTEETRRRVLSAVAATGYTPNIAARNLRARRTMMALVVVPDIANVFFSEILRGIDETLSEAGYGLIIANLDNSTDKETRYVDLVLAGQVDGVLLLCGHVIGRPGRSLREAGLPMVAVCERIPGETFPQVEIDNRAAARVAVEHLISLGHRRIAYLSGPQTNILDGERCAGYREALAAHGLKAEQDWHCPGDFTISAGTRAATCLLALPEHRRPTALFAANDEMAVGFLNAIRQAGLSVPGDIAIVGFDGIAYADFAQPALTTIVQPRRALGGTAAAILADMMQGRPAAKGVTRLATELLVRNSSRAAPAQKAGAR